MKSNSFFSFNRFSLLLKNDLLLNYKQYLLTIVAAFIVGYFLVYMLMPKDIYVTHYVGIYNYYDRIYTQAFGFCLVGLAIFVGLAFPAFSSKSTSQSYLMMPSSNFEKYLSQFLIRVVAGSVLLLAIFWIDAYLARATIMHSLKTLGIDAEIGYFSYSKTLISMGEYALMLTSMMIFVVCIGLYLFAVRLFFKKLAIFKTIISLAVLIFLIIMLFMLFSHVFYPEINEFNNKVMSYSVFDNHSNFEMWMVLMGSTTLLFLLPLGYFKLKEKEL